LLAASSHTNPSRAESLAASVEVNGSDIDVRVRHMDGRPAADVAVRLLYARQSTAAASRTDNDGRWIAAVTQPGPDEVIDAAQSDGDSEPRLPFTVIAGEETNAVPWTWLIPGIACCLGLLVLAFVPRLCFPTRACKALSMGLLLIATLGLLGWSAWAWL